MKPKGPPTDLDSLEDLITNARNNQLMPMIELHDAKGDWSRLKDLVDYWVQPEVVSLIQRHQEYLLVNIGSGVGDSKERRSITSAQGTEGSDLRDTRSQCLQHILRPEC